MIRPSTLDPNATPKRLLSIDGGGIRGIIAAEVLIRIEELLDEHVGGECLADHFHLIGGTSTGAILAAGLALGMRAKELRDFYLTLGPAIFKKEFVVGRLWHLYRSGPLAKQLRKRFGDTTELGSDRLRTLLMIVSKNVTTASTWFFTNNPNNTYFNCNRNLSLWKIIRASTAAPTYFSPQSMEIPDRKGRSTCYEFVDGGVSPFNNPAFQLFLEAVHPNYQLGWQTGAEKLLLLSVGTGFSPNILNFGEARHKTVVGWARYAIGELMEDANLQQNILMQLIGHTPRPYFIDRELGTGTPTGPALRALSSITGGEKLLTYHRYTISFTKERLASLGLAGIDCDKVSRLDAVDEIENLQLIGQKVAVEQVKFDDFLSFFPSQKTSMATGPGTSSL